MLRYAEYCFRDTSQTPIGLVGGAIQVCLLSKSLQDRAALAQRIQGFGNVNPPPLEEETASVGTERLWELGAQADFRALL